MMKTFKTTLFIFTMLFLSYGTAQAVETTSDQGGLFCSEIEQLNSRFTEKIAEREALFKTKKHNRLAELESKWSLIDAKRDEKRLEAETALATQFASLEARAETVAQQQAVTQFETSVKNALLERHATVEAILTTYQNQIGAIIGERTQSADTAVELFREQIDTAIDASNDACARGENPRDVRSTLKNTVLQARESLKGEVQSVETRDNIATIITERKQALERAQSIFKESIHSARIALEEAFK